MGLATAGTPNPRSRLTADDRDAGDRPVGVCFDVGPGRLDPRCGRACDLLLAFSESMNQHRAGPMRPFAVRCGPNTQRNRARSNRFGFHGGSGIRADLAYKYLSMDLFSAANYIWFSASLYRPLTRVKGR